MSEVRRYRKLRQREPLRVPSHWKNEDRAFVIQLNGQLDEVYEKQGELRQGIADNAAKTKKFDSSMGDWLSNLEDSDTLTHLWAYGDVRVISFQGKGRTHTEDEVLFTLPEEHRPSAIVRCSAFLGGTPIVVSINTNGVGTLWLINGATSVSARIYFNCAYVV